MTPTQRVAALAAALLVAIPAPALAASPPLPASVVAAVPLSYTAGYATPATVVVQGGTLSFANYDTSLHNVVSQQLAADGTPLFASALIGFGATADVAGVSSLPPGTYSFYCSIHPLTMVGTLIVGS